MTPAAIIRQAQAEGVTLALSPAGTIKAIGNGEAVNRWLPLIREHKPGIVAALSDQPPNLPTAAPTIAPEQRSNLGAGIAQAELTALVNLVADHHGFTPEQRREALQIALADQVAALECFRALAAKID